MTEWGVVGVIIALVGLMATVVPPIVKLNSSIVKLTDSVANIMQGLESFKKRYADHLNELKAEDEKLWDGINDHEHRITILETKEECDHTK